MFFENTLLEHKNTKLNNSKTTLSNFDNNNASTFSEKLSAK